MLAWLASIASLSIYSRQVNPPLLSHNTTTNITTTTTIITIIATHSSSATDWGPLIATARTSTLLPSC
jgi:hypothetical protein